MMLSTNILRYKTTLKPRRKKTMNGGNPYWEAYAFLYDHIDQAGLIYSKNTDFVLKPEETLSLMLNFTFLLSAGQPNTQPQLVTVNAGKVLDVYADDHGWFVRGKISTPFDKHLESSIWQAVEAGQIRLTVSTLREADVQIDREGHVHKFPLAAWCIFGDPGEEEDPNTGPEPLTLVQ